MPHPKGSRYRAHLSRFANPFTLLFAGIIALVAILIGHNIISPAIYTDPAHRFSIRLPAGSTVQNFLSTDGAVDTLIIRLGSRAVQATITKWRYATTTLTLDTLSRDYPYIAMQNAILKSVVVAGATGVNFTDRYSGAEQLWFVHDGYLYQLTDFGSEDGMDQVVADAFQFQRTI
jgi:hypothetical protein